MRRRRIKSFVNFFKSCPVQSETLVAHRSERNSLSSGAHWESSRTFLQEKRFSKTDCKKQVKSKIIQWMIFERVEPADSSRCRLSASEKASLSRRSLVSDCARCSKNKSFWSSFLQKARGFQRQSLWAPSAEGETSPTKTI